MTNQKLKIYLLKRNPRILISYPPSTESLLKGMEKARKEIQEFQSPYPPNTKFRYRSKVGKYPNLNSKELETQKKEIREFQFPYLPGARFSYQNQQFIQVEKKRIFDRRRSQNLKNTHISSMNFAATITLVMSNRWTLRELIGREGCFCMNRSR